jgi:hypothetical protein
MPFLFSSASAISLRTTTKSTLTADRVSSHRVSSSNSNSPSIKPPVRFDGGHSTAFPASAERTRAMHPWPHKYNTERPHSALKGMPPLSRIKSDNVLGNDT